MESTLSFLASAMKLNYLKLWTHLINVSFFNTKLFPPKQMELSEHKIIEIFFVK